MTTEDDFRRAIEADPTDWQTLAVFSDWLRDRDDARADGYAVLAATRNRPGSTPAYPCWWSHDACGGVPRRQKFGKLPFDWFRQLPGWRGEVNEWWYDFNGHADAFDAAAIAFSKLPASRREELLQATAGVA